MKALFLALLFISLSASADFDKGGSGSSGGGGGDNYTLEEVKRGYSVTCTNGNIFFIGENEHLDIDGIEKDALEKCTQSASE